MRRVKNKPLASSVNTKEFQLKGGLNEITSPLSLNPGELYAVSNYEPGETNGYRRIEGYERLDGQPSPSESVYWILNFDAGNVIIPDVGANVLGVTSGATGHIGTIVLESGAWDGTGTGYFVVYNVTGAFVDNESLVFTSSEDGFNQGFSSGFG